MLEFAEEEIILPSGEYEGRRFRCDRQPYSLLWFWAVGCGLWNRFVVTGCSQSGKTLCGYIIPLLHALFELRQNVVGGLPNLDIMADKWQEDILPVIERTRYREYLPRRGRTSKGGIGVRVQFENGATLRFMTGGGSDKTRSAFTAPVLVITETDGMDEPGARSREADKLRQLEARTLAYGARRRVYMECTVSIEEGRTWQEYNAGTASRIVQPCPHCGQYVTLQRSNLCGWQDAETIIDAQDRAYWACPECGSPWTENERIAAAARSLLVHKGQEIDERGAVRGDPPRTDTLGFRWSAPDNLFWTAGFVAGNEWRAARAANRENAEKEMRQFFWALPAESEQKPLIELDLQRLIGRQTNDPKGLVPAGVQWLTVGIDLGMYLCHWTAIGWRPGATGIIFDYGRIEVASRELGVDQALLVALREFRDQFCEPGWSLGPDGEGAMQPQHVFVDAQWKAEVVHRFCTESGPRYHAAAGHGVGQERTRAYRSVKKTGAGVKLVGNQYHIAILPRTADLPRRELVEVNADYWKSWLHARFATPPEQAGAVVLYRAPVSDHLAFCRMLMAEQEVPEYKPGKGVVIRWERHDRNNHFLDSSYLASAAGHLAGVRLIEAASDGASEGGVRKPMTLQEWRERRAGGVRRA